MALTLTEMQSLREELKRVRASGELRVSYQDKTVVYRSIAELDAAIASLDGEISDLSGSSPRKVRRYATKTGW